MTRSNWATSPEASPTHTERARGRRLGGPQRVRGDLCLFDKMSLLNCLSASIPGRERVVSCEEVFELRFRLYHRPTTSWPFDPSDSGPSSARDVIRYRFTLEIQRSTTPRSAAVTTVDNGSDQYASHGASAPCTRQASQAVWRGSMHSRWGLASPVWPTRPLWSGLATHHLLLSQQGKNGHVRRGRTGRAP